MKRNKFSLSHYKLMSLDMGELCPCGLIEVLPGDTIQMATSCLVRAAPLIAPVMHPVHVRIHHWYIPFRLIWDGFQDFITGGPDGLDATQFPVFLAFAQGQGTLADYLGVPIVGTFASISALPFRAYNLVWNEWYRDEDLQAPLVTSKASGTDTTTNVALQNCAWEKDYFTSARPWEQKGPTITVPIGTSAPVKGIGFNTAGTSGGASPTVKESGGGTRSYAQSRGLSDASWFGELNSGGAAPAPTLFADLTNASAVSINTLRQALALQRFEEARARYGSRYTEYLRYLGVRSSDARLQRPEYLGGGRQTIQFSEVLQTGPSAGGTGVADLKGHGIGAMRSNRFRRFIEEHGYILSLISVKPKTMYMQGLHRTFNRRVKEDFWQKELEHIGQMKILNKEIYGPHTTPDGTFGFQDRYDDYRRHESGVAGEFRTTTLNYWHMARDFASDPALNATFVKSVPTERSFAVPSQDVIYVMANHSIQARRLVAKTGSSFIF